jgi:hypothetical protein
VGAAGAFAAGAGTTAAVVWVGVVVVPWLCCTIALGPLLALVRGALAGVVLGAVVVCVEAGVVVCDVVCVVLWGEVWVEAGVVVVGVAPVVVGVVVVPVELDVVLAGDSEGVVAAGSVAVGAGAASVAGLSHAPMLVSAAAVSPPPIRDRYATRCWPSVIVCRFLVRVREQGAPRSWLGAP